MLQDASRKLIHARTTNPAWLLLASRRGPLVLGSLKPLFEDSQGEVLWDDAVQRLADMFGEHVNSDEFDIPEREVVATSRRELRDWMKRGLVVERDGKLLATDALEKAFVFIDSLDDETMTSTASRLATVQREIETLEAKLNPTKESRALHLKKQIKKLEAELARVEKGEFEVLSGSRAQEGIREIYQLAISLRADFRRVEDSYRDADRELRQEIVRADQDRGGILDQLLDKNDSLLETVEGQVFEGFYEQLNHQVELEQMKIQLRTILENTAASEALNRKQSTDLRYLVTGLIRESQRIIRARARGERDVKGFLKTGLASEHHRVGALLNELLETAWDIDWSQQKTRRTPSVLPPIAMSAGNSPVIQRLRFKEPVTDTSDNLDFTESTTQLDELGQDFWAAIDSLDRQALFTATITLLQERNKPLTLAHLAEALPPTHDLETLSYWLSIAREAGISFSKELEQIDIFDEESETTTRFQTPLIHLESSTIDAVDPDALG